VLNLDPAKLLIIAVVAVILLGPDKLPQVARQVGAAWRSFSEFRHKMESEVRSSIPDLPSSADIARLARSPSALLNHLSSMDADPSSTASTAPPTDSTSAESPTVSISPDAPTSANGATSVTSADASVTSADTVRDESPLTGVPIAAPDTVQPVSPVPTVPTTSPLPPNPPDPSLN
jgi:sec-independent protein translocase protein TatB